MGWMIGLLFTIGLSVAGLAFFLLSDKNLEYPFYLQTGLNLIDHHYADSCDAGKMVESAREAIFSRLDRYSGYLEPRELGRVNEEFSGSYGGIGVMVVSHIRGLLVMSVREGSPADRVGIRTGDVIIKADSVNFADISRYEASFHLRGPEGTQVKLSIARNELRDTLEFNLTREKLKLIHIPFAGLTRNNSLYIRILDFESGLTADLTDVLDSLYHCKPDSVSSVILDLRGNPGGLVGEAVASSNLFLEKGRLIAGIKGRSRWSAKEYHSTAHDLIKGLPLAILVDRGSASAAEIMAGALKYAGRAVLIGDTTFGKGLVQEYFGLDDGSGVRLTTARYYFEGNKFINDPHSPIPDSGAGIPPDYYYRSTGDEPFPLQLEGSILMRDFAMTNKARIVTCPPSGDSSQEWFREFVEFARQKEFRYESDLTALARFVRNELIPKEKTSPLADAAEKIYRLSESDDANQFERYKEYIIQRLYQIAVEFQLGEVRAYRDAILPFRQDIILAERILQGAKAE